MPEIDETTGSTAPSVPPAVRVGCVERPGDQIGPYRLLEILGEGGFGTVWLAERCEPFVQRVALKIIKAGMDTKAVIARFEQERQALAVMDHPNVAKVHDAGTTGTGRPYFVMERVAGEPITTYCDKHRLTIGHRLALFLSVCDAVQHAHTKGIIHRDLKPSNILVGVHDQVPVPKVIDFGIAKAVSHALTEKTVFTETGQLLGTVEYMSPEQAEMRGADIDTRSDVYSLGVVLYELLAGSVPFEPARLRGAGHAEVQRIIREVDPPRPSTRLTGLAADASGTIAGRRRLERGSLAAALKRELEWIPLKAIRKDRTERYGSPADLARDIRNYLESKPLDAGPESPVYRFRKLARRNRAVFSGAAAVGAALVLGMVGFAWQAHRIALERDATRAEKERAQAVTAFVVNSLRSQDVREGTGKETTVTEALTAALRRGDLSAQPATRAVLLRTISEILYSNGGSAEAEEPAREALNIERSLHPGDHPDVALGLRDLGEVLRARGRVPEAEGFLRQSLEMYERLEPGDSEHVAEVLGALAWALDSDARPAEAEPLDARALAMRRRLHPGDHRAVAESLVDYSVILTSLDRAPEALPLLEEARAMSERVVGPDHPLVSAALSQISFALSSMGRFTEAEDPARRALEMDCRLLGAQHPNCAWNLNNLGSILVAQGRPADAEPMLREALAIRRRLLGDEHGSTASTKANLAACLSALGQLPEALDLAQQAVATAGRRLPDGHRVRARCEQVLTEIKQRIESTGGGGAPGPGRPGARRRDPGAPGAGRLGVGAAGMLRRRR